MGTTVDFEIPPETFHLRNEDGVELGLYSGKFLPRVGDTLDVESYDNRKPTREEQFSRSVYVVVNVRHMIDYNRRAVVYIVTVHKVE
jgi:hypothetical protein